MELQWSGTLVQEPGETFGFQNALQQDLAISRDMAGLEKRLCEYIGVEHCISVDSATSGMLLALKAAGIGPGDAVLCTSFSYFAIAEIIELAGAAPMFVDINPNTFSIDPFCLEYVIGKCQRNKLPTPRALIAVDLFGLPCNYDSLTEICERHDITLIEDMAQSFGATYKGKKTGSFGRMAVASFFPAKPLGELGEGGAVFCHTAKDARQLQSLRRTVHMDSDGAPRSGISRGSHLDAVQASVVSEKLEGFDLELECRRELAEQYRSRLQGSVKMQLVGGDCESAYTQFVISVKNAAVRAELIEKLSCSHIPSGVFDPSPVGNGFMRSNWDRVALVNAQSVAQRILTIPMHPYLSGRVVDYICDRILEALESTGSDDAPELRDVINTEKKKGEIKKTEE